MSCLEVYAIVTTQSARFMARQLDATASAALTKLLDKVTDKHETHQDGAAVQQIKAFCKQSDENITWISSALLHTLKEKHAQVTHAFSHRCLLNAAHVMRFASPCVTTAPISAAPGALELSAFSLSPILACRRGFMW